MGRLPESKPSGYAFQKFASSFRSPEIPSQIFLDGFLPSSIRRWANKPIAKLIPVTANKAPVARIGC